jgi:hypothetical protein
MTHFQEHFGLRGFDVNTLTHSWDLFSNHDWTFEVEGEGVSKELAGTTSGTTSTGDVMKNDFQVTVHPTRLVIPLWSKKEDPKGYFAKLFHDFAVHAIKDKKIPFNEIYEKKSLLHKKAEELRTEIKSVNSLLKS